MASYNGPICEHCGACITGPNHVCNFKINLLHSCVSCGNMVEAGSICSCMLENFKIPSTIGTGTPFILNFPKEIDLEKMSEWVVDQLERNKVMPPTDNSRKHEIAKWIEKLILDFCRNELQ